MPYSAVTQPLPPPLSHGGTESPTVAVHSTWVSPKHTRQEPSAWADTPRSRPMGRMASAARLEGRILSPLESVKRRTLEEAWLASNGERGLAAVDDRRGAIGLACLTDRKRLPPLTIAEAETGAGAETAGNGGGGGAGARAPPLVAPNLRIQSG